MLKDRIVFNDCNFVEAIRQVLKPSREKPRDKAHYLLCDQCPFCMALMVDEKQETGWVIGPWE